VVIAIGSILFLAAAFSPISRIFGIGDAERKLEIIMGSRTQWMVAQWLFALGALVTAAGIGLFALRAIGKGASIFLFTSAALIGVGALLWSWQVFQRAVDPARFVAGDIPNWGFVAYSLMTILGLAVLGVGLLRTDMQPWVGWLSIGAAGLFLVVGIVFRDMPPFVYYIILLTIGFMLFRGGADRMLLE
jgi:hypothetical protein